MTAPNDSNVAASGLVESSVRTRLRLMPSVSALSTWRVGFEHRSKHAYGDAGLASLIEAAINFFAGEVPSRLR
jgi:hypothetical protein